MVRRTAAVAALTALLAGCTSLGDVHSERQALPRPFSSNPAATPSPTEPPSPATTRAEFRAARRDLFRAGTGEFLSQLSLGDPRGAAVEVERRGSYALGAQRADYTVSMGSGGTALAVQVRSTRRDAWYAITQVPGVPQPDRTCWIHPDAEVLSEAAGVEFPATPGVGLPPEVLGLATGRATGTNDSGSIVGDTDLYVAAALLGGQAQLAFGIPLDSLARVPAQFSVQDGRLTGWSVDIDDIITAADDAGYLSREARRQARAAWPRAAYSMVQVEYLNVGEPWTFRAPPPRATVEMSAGESFETAMRSCTGVGQSGA